MTAVFPDEDPADHKPASKKETGERLRGFHLLRRGGRRGERDHPQGEQESTEDESQTTHDQIQAEMRLAELTGTLAVRGDFGLEVGVKKLTAQITSALLTPKIDYRGCNKDGRVGSDHHTDHHREREVF